MVSHIKTFLWELASCLQKNPEIIGLEVSVKEIVIFNQTVRRQKFYQLYITVSSMYVDVIY